MIDHEHPLPVTHQCQILAIARSSVYAVPQPIPAATLAPTRSDGRGASAASLCRQPDAPGSAAVHRCECRAQKHMATLMRRMGIAALYQHPRTTRPHPGHAVFPYLLRDRAITASNQVWAMDITYIPMRRGFVYLAVVLDWATRRVLAWRLSNTMTVDFCLDALEAAIRDGGLPAILNTDQGSQFTGTAFVGMVQSHGIQLSMDGRGALARQPLRRAPLEECEIRRSVSACL